MRLDGLYMAQPFLALYEKNFGSSDYSDTVNQIRNVRKNMFDEEKKLYYHGYDSSRSMFWADPETGMYWQVPDQGGRLGVLDKEYAAKGEKTFRGISDRYLSFREGTLNLGGICLVAGLGPADDLRRDGSYEYCISEPVVENDAKGVAPFLLCYMEIKRLSPE